MSVLKRKADRTTTITLRIPVSIKDEIDSLRPLADANGFDVHVSLVDALSKCVKQMADELKTMAKPASPHAANGAAVAQRA
ncbi:MAG TPA: hypothetical protein VHY56_14230 [Candidatus Binataceae bacterium]|jgi:hypothetical protein|nr:hypothetical protein [Candidatus Binataceae bacterium]